MKAKNVPAGDISVLLPSHVNASDVIDENDHDTLYAFIVAIDEGAQDWDLTLRLCDYFEKQKQQWEAERAEVTRSFQVSANKVEPKDEAKQQMDNT